MESNFVSSIPGIQMYPIVALLFALTFFVSLIVWFFFHDRTRIEAYAQAPLEHDTCEQRDALHTHTTTF